MPTDTPEQPLFFYVRKEGEAGVYWSSVHSEWINNLGGAAVVPAKQRGSYTLPEGGELIPIYFEGLDHG